jgi:hypothetical protein
MDIEQRHFMVEARAETCWLTGDWGPLWSLVACSTGDGTTAGLRHIINRFADLVILTDRRLRDDWAA